MYVGNRDCQVGGNAGQRFQTDADLGQITGSGREEFLERQTIGGKPGHKEANGSAVAVFGQTRGPYQVGGGLRGRVGQHGLQLVAGFRGGRFAVYFYCRAGLSWHGVNGSLSAAADFVVFGNLADLSGGSVYGGHNGCFLVVMLVWFPKRRLTAWRLAGRCWIGILELGKRTAIGKIPGI